MTGMSHIYHGHEQHMSEHLRVLLTQIKALAGAEDVSTGHFVGNIQQRVYSDFLAEDRQEREVIQEVAERQAARERQEEIQEVAERQAARERQEAIEDARQLRERQEIRRRMQVERQAWEYRRRREREEADRAAEQRRFVRIEEEGERRFAEIHRQELQDEQERYQEVMDGRVDDINQREVGEVEAVAAGARLRDRETGPTRVTYRETEPENGRRRVQQERRENARRQREEEDRLRY
jgi:hypothetical protein